MSEGTRYSENQPLSRIELSVLDKILVEKKRNRKALRLVVYLGNSRPRGRIDYGLRLIERLEDEGHNVVGVIIEREDPVFLYPEIRIKKLIKLPPQLCSSISRIKHHIYEDPSFKDEFNAILQSIEYCQADLGIVFFGYWVPPEIYAIPSLGFINYHPGPLPYLRGMEPDTFAILENWKKIWGTVHRVDSSFDTGTIITRTDLVSISSCDTPVSVLRKLTREGIDTICKTVKHAARNREFTSSQLQGKGSHATLKMAYERSFIDWGRDSNKELDRKLRAFCGQDIGIRLKARFSHTWYVVYNLETFGGSFEGEAGDIIGYYAGQGTYLLQPIVRTIDGVAVLLLGDPVPGDGVRPEGITHQDLIVPPRKVRKKVRSRTLRKSIKMFKNIENFSSAIDRKT